MVFSFMVIEGKIYFILYIVGFFYGIELSFSVGFFNFSEFNFLFDFNFLCNCMFEEFINIVIIKVYEFLFFVFVYSKYVVKGIV